MGLVNMITLGEDLARETVTFIINHNIPEHILMPIVNESDWLLLITQYVYPNVYGIVLI